MRLLVGVRDNRQIPPVWFFGFGFCWMLWYSVGMGNAAVFPVLGENILLAAAGRTCLYASVASSFFIAVMCRRRLSPLHERRGFLSVAMGVISIGVTVLGLAGNGYMSEAAVSIGSCLVGVGVGVLGLAWGELFGSIGARLTTIGLAGGMLAAAVGHYAVIVLSQISPATTIPVLALTPWASLIWLNRAWFDSSVRPIDPVVARQPFRMPSIVLGGICIYGIAFGLMLGFANGLPASISADAKIIQVVGVGIAAILILVGASLTKDNLDFGFTYRPVLPLLVVGFALLPVLSSSRPMVASAFTVAGYAYFSMLCMIVYADISFRLPAPALAVNAIGAFADAAGVVLGMLAQRILLDRMAVSAVSLSTLSLVVVSVLVLASTFLLNERRVSTLWGLIRPEVVRSSEEHSTTQRCWDLGETSGLTSREQEVFVLLAKGCTAEQVQKKLVLSIYTVRAHTRNIYRKLGVHSQIELMNLVSNSKE